MDWISNIFPIFSKEPVFLLILLIACLAIFVLYKLFQKALSIFADSAQNILSSVTATINNLSNKVDNVTESLSSIESSVKILANTLELHITNEDRLFERIDSDFDKVNVRLDRLEDKIHSLK